MIGALKIGIAAGLAYTIGGKLGARALAVATTTASPDAMTGAMWAGRITTFLVGVAVLSKV